MEIISKQSPTIEKCWGVQNPQNVIYRPIKYLLTVKVDEGLLLQNTVTGELVLLKGSEIELFNSLPLEYTDNMKELVEHHYLVPFDYDEKQAVINLRKVLQLFDKKKYITGYTILPTTCCNARCFYCYEADAPKVTMTEETADDVIKFITEHCNSKKVTISWFGGEPTLGINRIDQISQGLKDNGVDFSATMISNGYLFDEVSVKKAKDLWQLKNLQITLDGTEDIYNKVKSYVGIKDSAYKRVLNNIELLLKNDINVSVRMNLDKHNYDDLKSLISDLVNRFKNFEKFSAYVYPLFDDCGYMPVKHSKSDNLWLAQKQLELNQIIIDNKKFIKTSAKTMPHLKFSHCMATNDLSVIINPTGDLSKCEHYYNEAVGNLKTGIIDYDNVKKWRNQVIFEECDSCPLFPTCCMPKDCVSANYCFSDTVNSKISDYTANMRNCFFNKNKL